MKIENYDRVVKIKSRLDVIDRLLKDYNETGFTVSVRWGCKEIEGAYTEDESGFGDLAKEFVVDRKIQLEDEKKKLLAELETL